MADEQDTPQKPVEAQPEAKPPEAAPPPPAPETPPEAPANELLPKQGESLEAYAARMQREIGWRNYALGRQRVKEREEASKVSEPAPVITAPSPPPAPPPPPRPAAPQFTPEVMAAAETQIEMRKAQDELDKNPEWPTALANFQRLGGIPQPLMDDILGTDRPAEVIIALGKDMNQFTKLVDMPERNRRAAIYKLGMDLVPKTAQEAPKSEPKKPSAAPAPKSSLPAGGTAILAEDSFDPDADCRVPFEERASNPGKFNTDEADAAWYARRAQQKANSKGRVWSPDRQRPRG